MEASDVSVWSVHVTLVNKNKQSGAVKTAGKIHRKALSVFREKTQPLYPDSPSTDKSPARLMWKINYCKLSYGHYS